MGLQTRALSGIHLSQNILLQVKRDVKLRLAQGLSRPQFTNIVVGSHNRDTVQDLKRKAKAASFCGIDYKVITLPENITQERLHAEIQALNRAENVDGISLQLGNDSRNQRINFPKAISYINFLKDVDGFHPFNIGGLSMGLNTYTPTSLSAITTLIDNTLGCSWLKSKKVTIVGRSNYITKPLQSWLQNSYLDTRPGANAMVQLHHEYSDCETLFRDLSEADMVVAATGNPESWLTGDMVKDGVVVIDCGYYRAENGEVRGEADQHSLMGIASLMTPVPGGVGPVSISNLMVNVLKASVGNDLSEISNNEMHLDHRMAGGSSSSLH